MQNYYQALNQLTQNQLNYNNRRAAARVTRNSWIDAVDCNCQIIICAGESNSNKIHALRILHSPALKVGSGGNLDYDGDLCGKVQRGVKPSPVWVADLGDYQVVTVFGANEDPRKKYITELQNQTEPANFAQIFPLPSSL